MKNLNAVDYIALVLVVVGGLNWGLVGILKFDLVATLFGDMSGISRIVYALVGLSAVYVAVSLGQLARKG
ncbi:MAG: DUF378 domain-containing protein [Minisyncoccia bacterium]|jgi:hypothetical protein